MNTRDLNFAYKVRQALNENLDDLSAPVVDKLAAARKAALNRKKPEARRFAFASRLLFARSGFQGRQQSSWIGRLGMALPLVVLLVGITTLYEHEERQRIEQIAEIDVGLLSDELPLSAYLDRGFRAFINQGQ